MKRLKIGVIGCGTMGGFHLKQYMNIPDIEIVGVSDIDPSRAPKDTKFYSDYNELLKNVDAVSVTSPTSTHYDVGSSAIEAGVNLLIEKPISISQEQAETLIRRAKAKGLILSVGHIERFNPAFMALKNEMGRSRPDVIDIKRASPFPERITDTSCVMDMMIHDIDLAIHLAASKVREVTAKGRKIRSQRLDQALAVLIFENGIVANIEADRVCDSKIRKLNVGTDKGTIEADLLNKKAKITRGGNAKELKVGSFDQLNLELVDFISAITGKKAPSVTGEDGLSALKVAIEIERKAGN